MREAAIKMNDPILVIMAAGMGSRYGGLKQMDPVGPSGELILDYSLFDAKRAGFSRAVIVIKRENEKDFREVLGNRVSRHMRIDYAYQDMDALPCGLSVPQGRVKPWGTAHAALCAMPLVDAPFCIINADDYYGVEAFGLIAEHLRKLKDDRDYAMVGYLLKNTLSDTGYVSRGVCMTDHDSCLSSIVERTHIIPSVDGPLMTEDGERYTRLMPDTIVSMNVFGFPPSFSEAITAGFPAFYERAMKGNPMKAEYYLPQVVDAQIKAGNAQVKVYTSHDRWYGVTYHEDRPVVVGALAQLAKDGVYPTPLWS